MLHRLLLPELIGNRPLVLRVEEHDESDAEQRNVAGQNEEKVGVILASVIRVATRLFGASLYTTKGNRINSSRLDRPLDFDTRLNGKSIVVQLLCHKSRNDDEDCPLDLP